MRLMMALLALLSVGLGLHYFANKGEATVRTAATPTKVETTLINNDGEQIGKAVLMQTAHGVLIHVEANGLTPGWHGLHIHEYGLCEAPTFESAGGHFNPGGKKHGYDNPKGYHAGDLPNVYVDEQGRLRAELFTDQVTLEPGKNHSLLRNGGTALMIHHGADDYRTDPSGGSGERVGCGVIGHPS